MTNLAKGLASLRTIGAATGGGILIKTEVSEDDYKKAKKGCVKPVSVRELIKAKKKNLLDVDKSGEENKEEWKKLSDQYEREGKGNKAIDGLTLPPSSGKTENDGKQLRTKCKELADKDFGSDKYDEELDKAIMWYTSESNSGIQ